LYNKAPEEWGKRYNRIYRCCSQKWGTVINRRNSPVSVIFKINYVMNENLFNTYRCLLHLL
jgi:hypothetical protein